MENARLWTYAILITTTAKPYRFSAGYDPIDLQKNYLFNRVAWTKKISTLLRLWQGKKICLCSHYNLYLTQFIVCIQHYAICGAYPIVWMYLKEYRNKLCVYAFLASLCKFFKSAMFIAFTWYTAFLFMVYNPDFGHMCIIYNMLCVFFLEKSPRGI